MHNIRHIKFNIPILLNFIFQVGKDTRLWQSSELVRNFTNKIRSQLFKCFQSLPSSYAFIFTDFSLILILALMIQSLAWSLAYEHWEMNTGWRVLTQPLLMCSCPVGTDFNSHWEMSFISPCCSEFPIGATGPHPTPAPIIIKIPASPL